MRRAAGALAGIALVALAAAGAPAQTHPHPLTKPPNYGKDVKSDEKGPGIEPLPSEETKSLLERAQRMHNQAYGLRTKADDLRDEQKYDDAQDLDDRADEYETRATDLERRAERERFGVKGPFKPAE